MPPRAPRPQRAGKVTGFTIQFAGLSSLQGKLSTQRQKFVKVLNQNLMLIARKSLGRVRDLTPVGTIISGNGSGGFTQRTSGETRDKWYLKFTGTDVGKKAGVIFVVDHPFNDDGATHSLRGITVNSQSFKLLEALEFGTRAHVIRARTAFNVRGRGRARPGLSFVADGEWVRTQEVDHPGTKAYAMTRIAANEASRDVGRMLQKVVLQLRKELGK